MKHWPEEFNRSIKSYDTEEKLDLLLYRPLGFLIAKAAKYLLLSPTHLTILGLVCGLASGVFFTNVESNKSLVIASVLLVLAGIFDSADGQLARLGGKSTKLGLVLDGICDNFVFASVYIGCIIPLLPQYGNKIWIAAVAAGLCHSVQSSMLDFYNREYLFFGLGKTNYWNPSPEELEHEISTYSGVSKFIASTRRTWIWQQHKISTRPHLQRIRWTKACTADEGALVSQKLYRDRNKRILFFWRMMGANFHTIFIITFAFLRRFDLYLLAVDIAGLTSVLILLRHIQTKIDQKFERQLEVS